MRGEKGAGVEKGREGRREVSTAFTKAKGKAVGGGESGVGGRVVGG